MASKHLMRLDLIFKNENDAEAIVAKTLARPNEDIVNELISSGLKGRGGAGFDPNAGGFNPEDFAQHAQNTPDSPKQDGPIDADFEVVDDK